MIETVEVRPKGATALILPLSNPWTTGLAVTSIDGIGPVDANVFTTNYGARPGGFVNGHRVGMRNITLKLEVTGMSPESIRQNAYRVMANGQEVTFVIHTDSRSYSTKGVVESFEPDIFSNRETFNVSIICPDPFFREFGTASTIISDFATSLKAFEFPWSNNIYERELEFSIAVEQGTTGARGIVSYPGSVTTGCRMVINFTANPGRYVTLQNENFGGNIAFENVNDRFTAGGRLEFSTEIGNRYARYIGTDNSVYDMTWNLWNYGDWPMLHPGDNVFVFATTNFGAATINFEYEVLYIGV